MDGPLLQQEEGPIHRYNAHQFKTVFIGASPMNAVNQTHKISKAPHRPIHENSSATSDQSPDAA
jgi:hypothetical protein